MMPVSDNLPQLRDIHLPEGVSPWPLAYGWWVILLGISALIAVVYLWKYIRRKSKKLYALRFLKKLEGQNTVKTASTISELLRRICIYKYPQAVSLSGKAWIDFLTTHSKTSLAEQEQELLLNSPYMPEDLSEFNVNAVNGLRQFCADWIGDNL